MYENGVGEGVFLWSFSTLFWVLWIKEKCPGLRAFLNIKTGRYSGLSLHNLRY